jgi:transcriptional regulator GlxA family with amidase domain
MTINVGIYIYNEVEVLDFAGPFEVFSTASRVKALINADLPKLFNVFTIGEEVTPILARGGLQILPKYPISDHPKINLLIIPGGIVSAGIDMSLHLVSRVDSMDLAIRTAKQMEYDWTRDS